MLPIDEVAAKLGLAPAALHHYGRWAAKIDPTQLPSRAPGKLVLVSAITPTPAGEGKTTTSIGLADALSRAGKRVCVALREPSLGPCFGIKGGGTGGGHARLVPSDRINLHFTGDFHAISSAHNLLSAAIDADLHFDNRTGIEARRVIWPRVLDMNDRSLRHVTIGLGGKPHGFPRETNFDITAASELMAMLCLAESAEDMRERIDRTMVAFGRDGHPVTASSLGVTGAMLALLRDAMQPNLVQTAEGTPALVHGGPFANIAHGCNSVIATKSALGLADWVVTEAGFGFDLGAEKFFDIKCRAAGLDTAAVVLVASVRALKMHGGVRVADLGQPDPAAVRKGLPNLEKHIENIGHFGKTPVVALNRFGTDSDEEVAEVSRFCAEHELSMAVCTHFTDGGAGAEQLARAVIEAGESTHAPFRPLYQLEQSIPEKIHAVATQMYGASDIAYTRAAKNDLEDIERLGLQNLPICVAKTQSSLSDDPKLSGRPRDFEVTVRGLQVHTGAGFLVVLTGDILRMPGLPKTPQAIHIDLQDGQITNLR